MACNVEDKLGNSIEYELDVHGNRVQEVVLDAQGTLRKTLQRLYDAYNRLERDLGSLGQATRYTHDAYGRELATLTLPNESGGLGTFAFNLRFPGQYWDAETGKHYNYFRDYDPAVGRYIESDPIGLRGGVNTYTYVANAPLRLVDPLGLKARVCCRAIGITLDKAFHCFIDIGNKQYGLHGDLDPLPAGSGVPGQGRIRDDASFNNPKYSDCGPWVDNCDTDDCVKKTVGNYPDPSDYSFYPGPNSNTFAGTVSRACKLPKPGGPWAPGWDHTPRPYSAPPISMPGG